MSSEQLTTGEVNKRFTSFIYDSILDESTNKITRLVSKGNRSSAEHPLTVDMLTKSLFINFLYRCPTDNYGVSIKGLTLWNKIFANIATRLCRTMKNSSRFIATVVVNILFLSAFPRESVRVAASDIFRREPSAKWKAKCEKKNNKQILWLFR
jgi:hypothetical protein